MTSETRSFPASASPARPGITTVAAATLTATAALITLVALGTLAGHVLLIPPLAASMALIAGAPSLPLSQPRHVVGGQPLSALVGVAIGTASHSAWAAALAGGLALGTMLLTRTSHSPAAATAVIGTTLTEGQLAFIVCAGVAAAVLVLFGLLRAAAQGAPYPLYWW